MHSYINVLRLIEFLRRTIITTDKIHNVQLYSRHQIFELLNIRIIRYKVYTIFIYYNGVCVKYNNIQKICFQKNVFNLFGYYFVFAYL